MNHFFKLATAACLLSFPSFADTADGDALIQGSWDDVVAQARGGEVNWFLWGGSDEINQYVSGFLGGILKDQYDVTLNRVSLTDTADAVNIVLGEREAGVSDKGTVDMIWINGENFRTMKQGGLAWCGYTDLLPNNALVDWSNPSIANDFGVPVNGCEVPWSKTQFAFAYNKALVETPPSSIGELLGWIEANPGQFTYPAAPDFNGSAFIRHVFYHVAGGPETLIGDFDQARFDEVATKTWKLLNDLEPSLWREGQTYPSTIAALDQLYANQEVSLTFNYEPATVGIAIENGSFPDTTFGFGLSDGTIGNTNYTLIPFNSPNKAAALVLQNIILSAQAQVEKAKPDVWGAAPAIDMTRVEGEHRAAFDKITRHPNVADRDQLSANALPELQAEWISAIDKGWIENVGN